ncbi:hypothetical protein [Azospirillum sp. TSO22-1]|uniref:hypothetical protein n=1 Tax=Azospirillum sp. TSO22-1 TaxID=716789 RepID=UPI000D60857E|nr:hypothetical protein [Azospirillum sp. TSO22-1]PWC42813.1 hypothetical protein TSO221_21020 [Azospirillum sp. TSO22-1]
MAKGYVGWTLAMADRAALLARFPPAYATVMAEHVTHTFPAGPDVPLPVATEGRVVGVADDGKGVQTLVVEIGGGTARPDGSTFHVTWSLGPGRTARESNDVISARGWTPVDPAPLRLEPRYFPPQRQ